MNATTAYTTSSADGTVEEPLPSDVPRDDTEHVEHGGIAKPGPHQSTAENVLRAQREMWKARAMENRARIKALEADLASTKADLTSAYKGLKNIRAKNADLRKRLADLTEESA